MRQATLDLLLLKAALSDGEEARAAWQEARHRIGSIPRLEGETYRLLPLLYRNLAKHGVEGPELEQLKGVYRHSWYVNQMLFREAGVLLGSLEQDGIETMVLRGGALSQLYYDDPAARPMEDVDVLVREGQVRQTIGALERDGWKPNAAEPLDILVRKRHSAEYEHPRGQKVDLHWSPLWQPTDERPFWEDAIPLEIGGTQTRALCPEDQLLHLCVHGVTGNTRTPYWVTDAVMLVRSRQGRLDWRKVVERARKNELTLALEYGLRLVGRDFEVDIPDAVMEQLGATPRSRAERRAHGMWIASGAYLRQWDRYRRRSAVEGRPASLDGFATYLGLANRRQLLGRLLQKVAESCGTAFHARLGRSR